MFKTLILAVLLSLTFACVTSSNADGNSATAFETPDVSALAIQNVRTPYPGVVTGGQLTPSQVEELEALGFGTFVSLRPSSEDGAGWEEDFFAGRTSQFRRLPVAGSEGTTEGNARRLARVLKGSARQEQPGVVVYCASGNRVGALFALKAHFVDGLPALCALEEGKQAGLTRLEPYVSSLLGLEGSEP